MKGRVSEIARKAKNLKHIEDQCAFIGLQVEMKDSFHQKVLDGNQADAHIVRLSILWPRKENRKMAIHSPKVQFVLCGGGDDITKWLLFFCYTMRGTLYTTKEKS
jgi:hypothetical protein